MAKKNLLNKYQPPAADSGDTAHIVTKAAFSFVPGAPDLFEYFVKPPLEKRLEKWREDVAEALRSIEKNKNIQIEALRNNDLFITIVIQATRVATDNHQKEKLEALKNIIINSASSNENEDIQIMFIRFIDELTPTHLYLLKFFINEERNLEKIKSYPEIYELLNNKKIKNISNDEVRMFIGDLSGRGLIRISQDIDDDKGIYQASSLLLESTNDNLPRIAISYIAKRFIRFISAL